MMKILAPSELKLAFCNRFLLVLMYY